MRRDAPSSELDLVPVMNLVTILIPFLLMASGMVAIAVVDTSLPASSEQGEADPTSRPHIVVGTEGFALMDAEGRRTDLSCTAPCTAPTDLDLDELTSALSAIRPLSTDATVTLSPADGVSYEVIIAVMDASRAADFPHVVLAGG